MTPAEVKNRCDELARDLDRVCRELNDLLPHLRLKADEETAEEAIQSISWASSLCTILGVHAVKPGEGGEGKQG